MSVLRVRSPARGGHWFGPDRPVRGASLGDAFLTHQRGRPGHRARFSAGKPPGAGAGLRSALEREGLLLQEPGWRLEPEVPPGPRGGRPATRGAHDVALAHEVG